MHSDGGPSRLDLIVDSEHAEHLSNSSVVTVLHVNSYFTYPACSTLLYPLYTPLLIRVPKSSIFLFIVIKTIVRVTTHLTALEGKVNYMPRW